MSKVFFGFDPGGRENFGWAILLIDENGKLTKKTGVVSDAPTAVEEADKAAGFSPGAVGIDAPLFWIHKGDRGADNYIRQWLGLPGTVMAVNSLRGACLVQGVLTAKIIHEKYPNTKITETHPKALLHILPAADKFITDHFPDYPTEHERDALLSAYAAWAMTDKFEKWHDLVPSEKTELFFPSGHKDSYWFPCRN